MTNHLQLYNRKVSVKWKASWRHILISGPVRKDWKSVMVLFFKYTDLFFYIRRPRCLMVRTSSWSWSWATKIVPVRQCPSVSMPRLWGTTENWHKTSRAQSKRRYYCLDKVYSYSLIHFFTIKLKKKTAYTKAWHYVRVTVLIWRYFDDHIEYFYAIKSWYCLNTGPQNSTPSLKTESKSFPFLCHCPCVPQTWPYLFRSHSQSTANTWWAVTVWRFQPWPLTNGRMMTSMRLRLTLPWRTLPSLSRSVESSDVCFIKVQGSVFVKHPGKWLGLITLTDNTLTMHHVHSVIWNDNGWLLDNR